MSVFLIYIEQCLLLCLIDIIIIVLVWFGFIFLFVKGFLDMIYCVLNMGLILFRMYILVGLMMLVLYVVIVVFNVIVLIVWVKYNQICFQVECCGYCFYLDDNEFVDSMEMMGEMIV